MPININSVSMYNDMYISWWVYFVTGLNLVLQQPAVCWPKQRHISQKRALMATRCCLLLMEYILIYFYNFAHDFASFLFFIFSIAMFEQWLLLFCHYMHILWCKKWQLVSSLIVINTYYIIHISLQEIKLCR